MIGSSDEACCCSFGVVLSKDIVDEVGALSSLSYGCQSQIITSERTSYCLMA